MLLRIASHHCVHDGIYETGSITFELIPAVVTLKSRCLNGCSMGMLGIINMSHLLLPSACS